MSATLVLILIPLIVFILATWFFYPSYDCFSLGLGCGFIVFASLFVFTLIWSSTKTSWETASITRSIPVEELNFLKLPNGEIQIWHQQELIKHATTAKECFRSDPDYILRVEFRSQEVFGPDYKHQEIIYKYPTKD